MTGWVILVDQPKDLPNADTPHKVITTSEYLARPRLFDMGRPKLVNLARSYAYQSKGYYASLLAEARGHRVMPTVETMLELREAKLYEHALPELEDELNRCARRADFQPEGEFKLLVCFGIARDPRFESFGRLLFDWFRCPALEVTVEPGTWLSIDRIRPRNITRLANGEAAFLRESLHQHTKREWRDPKARTVAKYDLAVLYDPNEKMPPSSAASIKYMARIAEKLSVDVEPITRRQLAELAEYDGLFIRETTSIDNHTYRFARRAWQEGMPVIDDPISMIRCTNKVFLMELLGQNQVATPPTVMLAEAGDLPKAMDELGLPLVVKIPDGSFSRGVHKVDTPEEFRRIADELFEETDLLLAQKFLPTEFDWRVGILVRRAAVRVPVPHGARPLADRQAPRPTAPRARAASAPSSSTRRRATSSTSRCGRRSRSATASTASTSSRPTTASSSWRSTTTPTSSTASRTRSARTRSGRGCCAGSSSASSSRLGRACIRAFTPVFAGYAMTAIAASTLWRCWVSHSLRTRPRRTPKLHRAVTSK